MMLITCKAKWGLLHLKEKAFFVDASQHTVRFGNRGSATGAVLNQGQFTQNATGFAGFH